MLRFGKADSGNEEGKNFSVTLDASFTVLGGLQVALGKLKEDAAGWKVVSVRHFDEDFGEYVDVTDET
ncbi:hypothetical protein AAVH_37328, partial [Aphelenchoides avenae]